MQSLSTSQEYSVVKLDGITEPRVALSSRTFFGLINLLDSCRGFVSGMKAKEDAVALSALLDRLNQIAIDYESVATRSGYTLEVPRSQARVEYEKAQREFESIMAQLEKFTKK